MKNKIAYLLHRFPRVTDTFIMREVRALQKAGVEICILSIWKPDGGTDAELINDWYQQTHFILPRSAVSVIGTLFASMVRSPSDFFRTAGLAFRTARPGFRGLIFQLFYFAEALLAAKLLRQNGITHVHNHFGDHSGIITMLAARYCKISYSISFHGPHVFFDGPLARIKEKVSLAQFIRCISYFCRSEVILYSDGEADFAKLKIVHCGLDLTTYQFRPPRQEVKRLFCAARLAPEKGFEFLLQALRTLKDQGFDLELHLIGDGPSRQALEAIARDLGVSDRVHFLGHISEEAKLRELHSADILVLPSLAEGLPSSATEAMAMGVPVIATNIAGISELIETGKTGILVRPSDPQALADALIIMIKDYEFRLRAAELGRKKVIEEFDVDRETARLKAYFLQT